MDLLYTERVRPLELRLTIHHGINTESSFRAESRVHHVPLYYTLMVADDFLLPAVALVLGLAPDSDALPGRSRLGGVAGNHKAVLRYLRKIKREGV